MILRRQKKWSRKSYGGHFNDVVIYHKVTWIGKMFGLKSFIKRHLDETIGLRPAQILIENGTKGVVRLWFAENYWDCDGYGDYWFNNNGMSAGILDNGIKVWDDWRDHVKARIRYSYPDMFKKLKESIK